jgi:hypothetical protein
MTLDGYAAIESNPVLGAILDATLTSLDSWQESGQMLSAALSDFARDRGSLEWLARAVALLGRHPKLANAILFALEEVADSQGLEGHLTRSLAPLGREPKLFDALSVTLRENCLISSCCTISGSRYSPPDWSISQVGAMDCQVLMLGTGASGSTAPDRRPEFLPAQAP